MIKDFYYLLVSTYQGCERGNMSEETLSAKAFMCPKYFVVVMDFMI